MTSLARRSSHKWLSVVLGLAIGFIALLVLVCTHESLAARIDRIESVGAVRMVHDHPALLTIARSVTLLGNPLTVDVCCAIAAVIAGLHRDWRTVAGVTIARLVTLACEQLVKAAVDRPRPHPVHPVAFATGSSFPSGHSTGIATVSAIVLVAVHRARVSGHPRVGRGTGRAISAAAVAVALLVGASRVLLGVHYPTDVLAGLCLGGFVTLSVLATTGSLRRGRGET